MKYTGCHEGLSERNKYGFQSAIKRTAYLSASKIVHAAQIHVTQIHDANARIST